MFFLAKHNYEPTLNGQGRELVVRKDCYEEITWGNSNMYYPSSILNSWGNSTYFNLFSQKVKGLIGTTKFPVYASSEFAAAVFYLSATEYGFTDFPVAVEGSALPIASQLRIALLNGSATGHWTRSFANRNMVYMVNSVGQRVGAYRDEQHGARPCFTLPADTLIDSNLNLDEAFIPG